MNILELKKELNSGVKRNLYIFVGKERGMANLYINKIMGSNYVRANSLSDIAHRLTSKGLFSVSNNFVVCDDKKATELTLGALKTMVGNNTLILYFTELDGRSKFYKEVKNEIVAFDKLNHNSIVNYILGQVDMDDKVAEVLANRCNNDYSRVCLEVDKLIALNEPITMEIVNDLVAMTLDDVIFDMVDCVICKYKDVAYKLCYGLVEQGESPIKIISLLYMNFRQLLLVQGMDGMESRDISAKTGLSLWQVNKTKERIGKHSIGGLINILKELQKAEQGIKTGQIEQNFALELLLVNILN